MSADDSSAPASRLDLLRRIAEALDMSPGALYEPEDKPVEAGAATLRGDARAMLSAFVKIRDPERRRACLRYVIAVANADPGAADDGGSDRDGP